MSHVTHEWVMSHISAAVMSAADSYLHCNALQRTATHCTATHYNCRHDSYLHCNALQHTALQHTATADMTRICRHDSYAHICGRCRVISADTSHICRYDMTRMHISAADAARGTGRSEDRRKYRMAFIRVPWLIHLGHDSFVCGTWTSHVAHICGRCSARCTGRLNYNKNIRYCRIFHSHVNSHESFHTWECNTLFTWECNTPFTWECNTPSHGNVILFSHGNVIPFSHGNVTPLSHGNVIPLSHGNVIPFSHGNVVLFSHGNVIPFSHGNVIPFSHGNVIPLSHGNVILFSHGNEIPFSHVNVIPFCRGMTNTARLYESCKIFKGRPRRNAFSKLVHRQYESFPPDRFCKVEIQNTTGLSNKPSTA